MKTENYKRSKRRESLISVHWAKRKLARETILYALTATASDDRISSVESTAKYAIFDIT